MLETYSINELIRQTLDPGFYAVHNEDIFFSSSRQELSSFLDSIGCKSEIKPNDDGYHPTYRDDDILTEEHIGKRVC
ncbi:hypothetical protein HYW74_02460 [Candidatus Pacearchaeota archaeon]|nr:hypothetical protein [Candidatus Pacearchaeota archaeon]MBI4157117.1 hypothetical protein [Candidatus Woesearchaeota archaeon]